MYLDHRLYVDYELKLSDVRLLITPLLLYTQTLIVDDFYSLQQQNSHLLLYSTHRVNCI